MISFLFIFTVSSCVSTQSSTNETVQPVRESEDQGTFDREIPVEIVMVGPGSQREGVTFVITSKNDTEELTREMLGMAPKAETEAVTEYISLTEARKRLLWRGYVKVANTPSFLDPEGKIWTGIAHDRGIFAVLEELPNGFLKTVIKEDAPEGMYTVVYFREGHLTSEWRDTWYVIEVGGDYEMSSQTPDVYLSSDFDASRATAEFIPEKEIIHQWEMRRCIKNQDTPAYLDPQGRFLSGVVYGCNEVVYGLELLPNGFLKAIDNQNVHAPQGMCAIIYFREGDLK